ncbi:unnamed protein product, partial [Effrenium voratum]
VIGAILAVTPKARLSEPVLAEGILELYTTQNLAPAGISQEAMTKWAYGARKVCQKFRRIMYESPNRSKSDKLQVLKDRLSDTPSTSPTSSTAEPSPAGTQASPSLPATPGCLEAFDPWAVLKQKLVALKAQPDGQPESSGTGKAAEGLALKRKAAQPEGLESSAGKAATGAAPSRHSVPEHVLSALSKLTLLPPSKPFSTAPEGQKGAKPAAKKQPKHSAAAKKKAEDELDKQLDLAAAGEAVYKPGDFQKLKAAFVNRQRSAGKSFAEATKAWMLSSDRAQFLTSLSEKELKRRRFA